MVNEISKPKSVNELLKQSRKNFIKRALGHYLFPRNPNLSVKIYRALGVPIIRKAVMGTAGKASWLRGHNGNNYRLDTDDYGRMTAEMDFAAKASVFNEAVHTAATIQVLPVLIDSLIDLDKIDVATTGNFASASANFALFAFNAALVALQRYNRARMTVSINKSLEEGERFDEGYRNWLGLDNTAIDGGEAD